MGFNLASRCSCCENPEMKTIDHLFVSSETASSTWRHFADTFHLSTSPSSVDQLAQIWLNNVSLSNPSGISRNIIFGNMLSEIWKQRNEIIYGKGKRSSNFVISRVTSILQLSRAAFNFSTGEDADNSSSRGDQITRSADRLTVNNVVPSDGQHCVEAATVSADQRQVGAAFLSFSRANNLQFVGAAAAAGCSVSHCHLDAAAVAQSSGYQQVGADSAAHTSIFQQHGGAAVDAQHSAYHRQEGTAAAVQQRISRAAQISGIPAHISDPWMAPASGLKLNIAGRVGDPPCTAGSRIIRDANGNFIGALYFYLDEIAIVIPKLEVLLYAATCCREKNWVINEVETSSQRLINIMLKKLLPGHSSTNSGKFGLVSLLYRCSSRSPPELIGWQKL
ncbi:uncharacterized protein M6B38_102050 [Iris pallida]|uniref:RNase H type-1 domain-containing protein n=1 Tax=Iris pallida TaxID=29817 RepID=A0AAX6GIS6_IRIPA|nr:uncharacterized protein M6B38_366200 [Iris pallida]KAJ6854241.1 uncharacterized protein M6B38_102050 [Iris pallida]